MKIIITTRVLYPFHGYGGMERYVYYIAKYLAENGADVEVVTSLARGKSGDSNDFKVTFLPPDVSGGNKYLRPALYRKFLKNTAKYLQGADFDILYSFGVAPVEYLKSNSRKPVIIQPFGSEEFVGRSKENPFKKIYLDLFMRRQKIFSLRNADAIASEGEIQTREIINLFDVPRKKIFLLPDGVDLSEVKKYGQNIKIKRSDFNLQDADIVLINANRLAPNKGVCYLIEALKILNARLNAKLILIGAGVEETNIKKQINDLGLVGKVAHFKNIPNEKMFQLYSLADISVTPTLYEGLPLVVLEAMAAGMPIVASDVSEVPQVVKNGENGFLVPPRDPSAIAAAILKICEENLFVKMGERSKEIAKKYDWGNITKQAIERCEKLINEKMNYPTNESIQTNNIKNIRK